MNFPGPWDKVTAVIVTYNSAGIITSCLEGLKAARRVVVVDNASSDNTCEVAEKALPGVNIIRNPRNVGYGTAANQGMAQADTPYGLTITPDAMLSDEDLGKLVAALEKYTGAALAAPYLYSAHGDMDLPVMGPSEHNHRQSPIVAEGDFSTWFVTGAVWLWRLDAWSNVGGFDENIFLYNDDAELCLRATKAGYSLVVVPNASARHLGGASSPPSWRVSWLRDWHMIWSHLYLEKKHGDPTFAIKLARQQLVHYALKSLFYFLILRRRKALRDMARASAARAFLKGYQATIMRN